MDVRAEPADRPARGRGLAMERGVGDEPPVHLGDHWQHTIVVHIPAPAPHHPLVEHVVPQFAQVAVGDVREQGH